MFNGLGFCSLYCPLYFDYGVGKMIMNLRMIQNNVFNYFQKYGAAILSPPLRTFHARSKNQGSWENR